MLEKIEELTYWFLSHPILGSALGFIGIFLAYYFFRKQTGKDKKIDQTIARLQEEMRQVRTENGKLVQELIELGARKPDPATPPVAGREFVVINLRGKWQKEDEDVTFVQAGLPALVVGCVVALCLGGYWYQNIDEGTAEDWTPGIVFVCGVIGLLVAGAMVGFFKKLTHAGKDKRLAASFFDANLSLIEINDFREWARGYPWRYFSRDSIIREIDSLAVVKSQQALKEGVRQVGGG